MNSFPQSKHRKLFFHLSMAFLCLCVTPRNRNRAANAKWAATAAINIHTPPRPTFDGNELPEFVACIQPAGSANAEITILENLPSDSKKFPGGLQRLARLVCTRPTSGDVDVPD